MKDRILLMLVVFATITGCQSSKEKNSTEATPPAEVLYKEAEQNMGSENFKKAADNYGKIMQEYPYSNLAIEAQFKEALAYYKMFDYDMAIPSFDGFISQHPGYEHIAQIYHLRFLSYYDQINDVERDQKTTENALYAGLEILAKFPHTEYAKDVKYKLDLIYDHLAGQEMVIGRFYLKRNDALASIKRFERVVAKYQTTSHIQEALYRLVEANIYLGLYEEAKKNAAVLGHNYPASKWYQYTYDLLKQHSIK